MGLRIDHILLSPALAKICTACEIDVELRRQERPSDHAAVVATLKHGKSEKHHAPGSKAHAAQR